VRWCCNASERPPESRLHIDDNEVCFSPLDKVYDEAAVLSSIYIIKSTISMKQKYIFNRKLLCETCKSPLPGSLIVDLQVVKWADSLIVTVHRYPGKYYKFQGAPLS
jgi:cAMP phosphodiesterase